MITDFHEEETRTMWCGEFSRRLPGQIQQVARRKLRMLNNAQRIEDLRIPPNNRLEALEGSRAGQWSICINDQWRNCFTWTDGQAGRVQIYDLSLRTQNMASGGPAMQEIMLKMKSWDEEMKR